MSEARLAGQVALVTGASRGIGYESALAFAREGATIVAVARTVGGLEELDDEIGALGGEAVLVPLDLTDGPGVDRLAPALAERFGNLDILLGCAAALGVQTPIAHMAEADWQAALNLNLTANWRLLRGFDPLLRAAPSGRALFLTCEAAETTPAFLAPYAVSKAGLNALIGSYARETLQTNVTANLVDPGPTDTRLRARYLPGEDRDGMQTPAAFASDLVDLVLDAGARSGATWHHSVGEWQGGIAR